MKSAFPKKLSIITSSKSGETLWTAFRNGDRDAFAKIYRNHIDDLFHYGIHFCKDGERVKDCLQDLFQDMWSEREHLTPEIKNLKYYLISSLRRRLLRSLQKDRQCGNSPVEYAYDFEFILSKENSIIEEEYKKEQDLRLHQAVSSLSRRQQETVYLRFYQNLSYAEIAQLMSMKVESVYNLISKSLGILKKVLKK